MAIRICPYCKSEFKGIGGVKFCSPACRRDAARRAAHERHVRAAAELGIDLEEFERLRRNRHCWADGTPVPDRRPKVKQPKAYREIVKANRKRRVKSGWRGQVVMGGGVVHRNDPELSPYDMAPHARDCDSAFRRRARYLTRKEREAKAAGKEAL